MNKNLSVFLILLAAGCGIMTREPSAPPLDPNRRVVEQDCSRSIEGSDANLMCREVSDAERRARIAEEEQQARARKEAEERAARERLEAEQEAARRARAAEEERLAAERRRLEEAAALKAQQERERREKAEAEALALARAEQERREAAERECQRLEQERSEARAQLEYFVATYGKVDEFKGIAGQIAAFLEKARKPKPCPPAR